MIDIDPQQELFTRLLKGLKTLGYSVYDGALPPEGTPYPFVYLGEMQQTDAENKTAVFGLVQATIHVWHDKPRQRGTVSGMLLDIKNACRHIDHTPNFAWSVRNISQRIITDDTTKAPLLHGVLDIEFSFS